MGMSINNNASSVNAQVNLNSVSRSLGGTMERVSSGLRINSAKDDAAGMSIASKIGAQVSGMGQAARNVGSAMLLAKTAESDLGLMRDGLVRMRTLAVQSADGSYSAAERTKMNNEFVELRKNIESIANTSNFNGKKLLDGSMQNQQFQVGANANETIAMSVGSVSTAKLGSSAAAAISTGQSPTVGTGASGAGLVGLKEGAFSLNGVTIGPSLAAADTASFVKAEASSIAKAAAVNLRSAQTGVTATVNSTEVAGHAMTAKPINGTATINGVAISIQTTGDAASSRAAVITAINAQEGLTGVTAVDSGTDKGGVSLIAKDGRNITLDLNAVTAASTGLGFYSNTELAGTSMTPAIVANGTATINGTTITVSTTADGAASRAAVVAAINAVTGTTGVTAVDTGDNTKGVTLTAKDGAIFKVDLGTLTAAVSGLTEDLTGLNLLKTSAQTAAGSITLNSDKAIAITSNQTGALGSGGIKDAGLSAGTFQAQTAYVSSTAANAGALKSFTAGDFSINGSQIGATIAASDTKSYSFTSTVAGGLGDSKALSGISKAAAINALTAQTGVTATTNATQVDGAAMASTSAKTSGQLVINGVRTATISTAANSTTAENRAATVAAINAISGQTGVIATDTNDDAKGVTLSAADGRNITAVLGNTITDNVTPGTFARTAGTLTAASTGLGINMTATYDSKDATATGTALTAALAANGGLTTGGAAGTQAAYDAAKAADVTAIAVDAQLVIANGGGTADVKAAAVAAANVLQASATEGRASGTTTSTLTLSSASAFTLAKGSTDAGTDALGMKSGEYGAGRSGGALSMANLLTADGARAAMASLDNSLNTVDALKADMGTMQNRFQSSADSLSNSIQNQQGAKDQIEQSDFIADTAKLTMEEFRAQVAGSTQAKANALQATMLQALIPR